MEKNRDSTRLPYGEPYFHCSTSDSQAVNMTHLAGIDKGPVLDWTDDNGLMEHYCKWTKKVEVLFKGPRNNTNDPVKCNYIIYWSGDIDMELVEKWEIEGNYYRWKKEQYQQVF